MDTSVLQFYPTLFTLVVDVMDMLGTLVWERIRMRAEYGDDGTLLRSLPGITTNTNLHGLKQVILVKNYIEFS